MKVYCLCHDFLTKKVSFCCCKFLFHVYHPKTFSVRPASLSLSPSVPPLCLTLSLCLPLCLRYLCLCLSFLFFGIFFFFTYRPTLLEKKNTYSFVYYTSQRCYSKAIRAIIVCSFKHSCREVRQKVRVLKILRIASRQGRWTERWCRACVMRKGLDTSMVAVVISLLRRGWDK